MQREADRVIDGAGGDLILSTATDVLRAEFPELAERIREKPPSEALRQRLPARWLRAVDAALAKAT